MRIIHALFGLSADKWTAIATVANSVVVIVLVIINVKYLIVARKQAAASIAQAAESQRQADAAMENLRVLKQEAKDEQEREVVRSLVSLSAVYTDVKAWLPTTENKWGMPPATSLQLLPDDWSNVVYQVGKISPELHIEIRIVERLLLEANSRISHFLNTPVNFRDLQLMHDAHPNLKRAESALLTIITACEKQLATFSQ